MLLNNKIKVWYKKYKLLKKNTNRSIWVECKF